MKRTVNASAAPAATQTARKPAAVTLPAAITGPSSKPAQVNAAMRRHGVPPDLEDVVRRAIESRLLPAHIKGHEQAVVIALKGRELGLPPMQAWASIYVIQGVPTLSASLMLGIAYRNLPTFDLRVIERSAKKCIVEGRRSPAHSWVRVEYTWADAEQAGLTGKDNWRKGPADMLCARATGRLCRLVAPDTFTGLYATEEIDANGAPPADEPMEPVAPVTIDVQLVPDSDKHADDDTGRTETAAGVTYKMPPRDRMIGDIKSLMGPEIRREIDALGKGPKFSAYSDMDLFTVLTNAKAPGYQFDGPFDDDDATEGDIPE